MLVQNLTQLALAEAAGSALIVLFGCGSVTLSKKSHCGLFGIAATFGAVVTIVATMGLAGNPCVSLAQWAMDSNPLITGLGSLIAVIGSQIVGATIAAFALIVIGHSAGEQKPDLALTKPASGKAWHAFGFEFCASFILMAVILATGDARAIGLCVFLEVTLLGPICGASMNFGRTLGPAIAARDFQYLFSYAAGTFGGMLACAYTAIAMTR